MNFFDTHCHIDDEAFEGDLEDVLGRAREAGVARILVPATTLDGAERARTRFAASPQILLAAGVHPESAHTWREDSGARLAKLLKDLSFVAVGETGLDRVNETAPLEIQRTAFRAQVAAARAAKRPLLVHSRGTMEEILEILLSAPPGLTVLHAFGGDGLPDPAGLPEWIYLGIGGIFTFKKSDEIRSYVRSFPRERLLLETDAPYLSPEPRRGRRNEPANLPHIARKLGEVLGIPPEEVARLTSTNAERFLALPAAKG